MPVYTLSRTQLVRMSLTECWNFFSDPRNLATITPPELRFQIQSELPREIYPGLMISYTVAPLLGVRLRWLTEIVQMNEPTYFADEQRQGPYRLWHHEHFFREIGEDQTEVRDLIHYVPPFGPLGGLINALVIRRQLEAIFDYRSHVLAGCAGEGAREGPPSGLT
jgi:ligand-binding SRPBCC domain-containing protein